MKSGLHVSETLSPIAAVPTQCYLTDTLQVADILHWILTQTGPADVRLSSFSVSDEFLRRLFFIEKTGLVRSLQMVLDFKATHKTLALWPFIAQTVDKCYLASNHSKILLVTNGHSRVAVVTSQNLTRGNRHEAGIVTTDSAVIDRLTNEFDNMIQTSAVPFNDIFSRTVGQN